MHLKFLINCAAIPKVGMLMRGYSLSNLKNDLEQFAENLGAYDMRVADPKEGFETAISGCHPKNVWKQCSSVVVFGIYVGLDYYRSIELENLATRENRIMHIFRDWLQYKMVEFIQERGYHAITPRGYFSREKLISRFSLKLAACEAGLGVYGRCGIIITPKYGPRVNFGIVLTDAELEPDEKLTDFDPCLNCRICVDLCPPKAIQETASPPMGHNRDKCINFVQKLREKMGDKRFYCGCCYSSCPVGKTDKHGFRLSRHRSLLDLTVREREHLISDVFLELDIDRRK